MAEVRSQTLPNGFPIVGIVASAGGLDAFKKFFLAMPPDSGMAFVLIPHLDPSHESLMVGLLGKLTSMSVFEAGHDVNVQANCVYIIPPNKFMAIANGRLQLSEPKKQHAWETSIDFFLRSLALDQKERAIGIVLSGTGSHGALGIREIKLAGGMAIAQQPETAEYDQMPANAIATGQVDCVLPPEQMPAALLNYVEHPYLNNVGEVASLSAESTDLLNQVLTLLQSRTKYDFRCYRKAMVLRRIQRRMSLVHIDSLNVYLEMLQQRPEEITALYKDLLISVTAFFRDAEAYSVLEQELIPALIARHTTESPIRIWVPGCATGEEAYSIAMLLIEGIEATQSPRNIQIFASDIDQDAIDVARAGIYPASISGDISPDRLNRFFAMVDYSHYQVNKHLRDLIVFSHQNLIADAPFSKLDLISCRNLLIYLELELQQKVIAMFHFSLSADGYLLLGPSETIGKLSDLFETVSKKWRIYRRIGPTRRDLIGIPFIKTEERPLSVPHKLTAASHRKGLKELTERLVLNEYAPAVALVNRKFEVLYVTGPLVNYLEFPLGEMTKDLLAMARTGLRAKLRVACNNAIRDIRTIVDTEARVKRNGHYYYCAITVRPVSEAKDPDGLMLVVFQDRGTQQSLDEGRLADSAIASRSPRGTSPSEMEVHQYEDSALVQQLEFELKSMSEELHSTIEEMESTTEELKTSNEEIMSVNEELQSANEELETSKEELQSLNEELSMVNSQLQDKVAELEKATDNLMNLMSSTEIATIFLDTDLNIKQFTPPTKLLLNLRPSDIGRPFREIAPKFPDDPMLSECQQVLGSLTPLEREVQTNESTYYLRRILPFRTADHQLGGVAITFIDLTQRKQAEARQREADLQSIGALQEGRERMAAILNTASDAIFTMDQQGKIEIINWATEALFGYTRDELIGQHASLLIPSTFGGDRSVNFNDFAESGQSQIMGTVREVVARRKNGSLFPAEIAMSKVNHLGLFTGILRDISDRKKLQSHILEIASDEQRRIGHELHDGTQQELTGLTLFAGTLCDYLESSTRTKTTGGEAWMFEEQDLDKLKQTAARLLQGLKEANQHVHALSHGIMPVLIDAEGLQPALVELAAVTNEQQKVHCHIAFSGSSSVDNNSTATELYRIAQEALNNALKHGLADDILISLSQQDQQIILEVCDNGVGIDPQVKNGPGKVKSGLGLRIMEYRASMLGGVLQVARNTGRGTTVRCIVPTTKAAL
jgi:two-component system, chemotaxis family, CheB/CheR fusion protein